MTYLLDIDLEVPKPTLICLPENRIKRFFNIRVGCLHEDEDCGNQLDLLDGVLSSYDSGSIGREKAIAIRNGIQQRPLIEYLDRKRHIHH